MDAKRSLVPMAAVVVLLGGADSMTGTYLVLFASEEAGLSPLRTGLFISAIALGGIVFSTVFGRAFDRTPARRWAAIAAGAGAIGFGLLPGVTDFAVLILVALSLLGIAGAGYPQVFALADVRFTGRVRQRATPLLRSGWSLAWAVGPLLGAWILAESGYDGLFRASAIALLLTVAAIFVIPRGDQVPDRTPDARPATARSAHRLSIVLLTASMVLVHTAMFAGSVALPLFVTGELDRTGSAVGVLFSLCAVVEIVAALALIWLMPRMNGRLLILLGLGLFVAYFLLIAPADGLVLLLIGQVARGTAIAVIGTAGIQHFQAVLAPASGTGTALFANSATAGSLVSGVLAGGLIELAGTRITMLVCGGLSLLAVAAFGASRRAGHRLA
ncbi:MFS transporter [Kribbella sp. CA-247076]|uniref:MFS transporter n=1 Tax=Kribbella sp. CA-247076 TaxID=3239941 RepID=UPI003D93D7A6